MMLACGRRPNLDFLDRAILRRIDAAEDRCGKVVDGLYLIGDVIGGKYRQTGIAVGDGLRVGMHVEQLIRKKGVGE